jgi:hypothetical protein
MRAAAQGRPWRALAYALMALAGVAALVWPAPAVRESSGAWVYAWSVLLVVGGGAAFVGVCSGWWLGEYAGLPPLAFMLVVYAAALPDHCAHRRGGRGVRGHAREGIPRPTPGLGRSGARCDERPEALAARGGRCAARG